MVEVVLFSVVVLFLLAGLLDRFVFRGNGVGRVPRAPYHRGQPVGVDGEPEFQRPPDEASRL